MHRVARSRARAKARGQAMQVFALLLGLGVLIGMLAIAFDGGSALLQRRTQQNAADAGVQAGIEVLGRNMLVTCAPVTLPCHTIFMTENNVVIDRVNQLASSNQGGTTGAPVYAYTVEYHYMSGAPVYSGTYQPAPYNTAVVPPFVDGLRVTATVQNPTTFARSMSEPSNNVRVSARAAARLRATCPPEPNPEDSPLPFTRFRPALEMEMYTKGNDPCNPYIFWESNNDVQTANNGFKNIVSFNQNTMFGDEMGANTAQLIDDYDHRDDPVVGDPYLGNCPGGGDWPDCGLYNFSPGPGWTGNLPPYCDDPLEPCADMPGSSENSDVDGKQDVQNWIYWQWRGALSLDTEWIAGRTGDWAEIYDTGNWGNAIHDSVGFLANDWGSNSYYSGPPLNWGRAVTRTVYLWGEGLPVPPPGQIPSPIGYSDSTSTQYIGDTGCPQNCNYFWRDARVVWNSGPRRFEAKEIGSNQNAEVQRVRFTDRRTFVFYEALNGNGNVIGPGGCNIQVPTSAAMGFFPSTYLPGPNGDNCPTSWVTGSGVYSTMVDPNGP